MRNVSARHAAAICLALLATAATTTAQIPDKFTNLQVLPKEISRAELITVMRQFASGLGVRCNHCHVGQNAATLEGFDFAADDKEPKKVARVMMRMTKEINEKLLPATGREKLTEVRCMTCHRRLLEPETLDRLLAAVAAEQGVDAALARYRELRDEHGADGTYDFGPRTLNMLAEELARVRKDVDGGIRVMRFNAELHPSDVNIPCTTGEMLLAKGDRPAALASFERCLELQPDNARLRRQVEQLRQPQTKPAEP